MVELIKKKRDGGVLTSKEINDIIAGYVAGDIPDYQISAWLMAVYFRGMNDDETAFLTTAMMNSGDIIDLSVISGIKVDKHSTGGVGDKTTLILAPLVAAAGVPIAKMSGRGLGHTGGTLDKLESISGFKVDMSPEEFIEKVKNHSIAICSQNNKLVPADKKLYALRDVTATVDNISLIASSVMSKKMACGADAIVIDLKVGDGAFIKNLDDAQKLANIMIATAQKMGRKLTAVITSMEEPLGFAIGNALEVKEAVETLKGHGPEDLKEVCLELGSQMLILAGKTKTREDGLAMLNALIENGKAFDKFLELVDAQQGDISVIKNTDLLPNSSYVFEYKSKQEGFIAHLGAMDIGLASVSLGAGRETKESKIDMGAGILLEKKVGDFVKEGDVLALLYADDKLLFKNAELYMDEAFTISLKKQEKPPLIYKIIQ